MVNLGPNVGRSGGIGACDPLDSAPKVPEFEDLLWFHSGDNTEDATSASGARIARCSQRHDVSTSETMFPSAIEFVSTKIAPIALQQPGTDLDGELGNNGIRREGGEPEAGESIQGCHTTRESSAASPQGRRCQRMHAQFLHQGEKSARLQLRMQHLLSSVVPAVASEREGEPDPPPRMHHPERSALLTQRHWHAASLESSSLRKPWCRVTLVGQPAICSATGGQPATLDGRSATSSATEILGPSGQPAAQGLTAVSAVPAVGATEVGLRASYIQGVPCNSFSTARWR